MASFFRTNNYSPLSKRDTIGYYFDDNGEFKSAQPYELRPKFVWSNNKMTLDDYIYEPESKNNPSSFNSLNNDGLFINSETCVGFTDEFGRWGFTRSLKPQSSQNDPIQVSGSYDSFLNSLYVECDNFNNIDIKNNNNECEYVIISDKIRRYYYHGYFQPQYFNLTTGSVNIKVCGGMAEDISLSYPTSWIPYNSTRSAD